MRGICNELLCVCLGFVMCFSVYVWDLKCVVARMCGFCNVYLCVSVGL